MNDVKLTKLSGGLGRRNPTKDMISGLIISAISVGTTFVLDTVYRLRSLNDLIDLGVKDTYDTTNKLLVYEHVKEFFRVNPNGDLYILPVARTVSPSDMLDQSKSHAPNLIKSANGDIRQLGISYNPTTKVTAFTLVNNAVAKAQELATYQFSVHAPLEIILEGVGYDLSKPVNFREKNAPNVSVMVGQSKAVATKEIGGSKPYECYAAIGTILGAISKANVNQCIAWVSRFNIKGGTIEEPAVYGGATKKTITYSDVSDGEKETLNDNGALFFIKHIGNDGVYFNDSHTSTAIVEDYAYIENNRTIHKATRAIRDILLPHLNSPVLIEEETGQLSPDVVKFFENEGRRALETMESNAEISALDVYVDPNQNILSTSELKVEFEITPTGTARSIHATIGFVNPF